jgi:hypothetical protein
MALASAEAGDSSGASWNVEKVRTKIRFIIGRRPGSRHRMSRVFFSMRSGKLGFFAQVRAESPLDCQAQLPGPLEGRAADSQRSTLSDLRVHRMGSGYRMYRICRSRRLKRSGLSIRAKGLGLEVLVFGCAFGCRDPAAEVDLRFGTVLLKSGDALIVSRRAINHFLERGDTDRAVRRRSTNRYSTARCHFFRFV